MLDISTVLLQDSKKYPNNFVGFLHSTLAGETLYDFNPVLTELPITFVILRCLLMKCSAVDFQDAPFAFIADKEIRFFVMTVFG